MIHNQKIQEELEALNWNDFQSVIDFYEGNLLYFENKSNLVQSDEIDDLISIQISYILSLETKKHYQKASKVLGQTEVLIERIKGTDSFDKINEKYLYAAGIIAQRLKDYDESQRCFSKLIKIDPENDVYLNWYKSNEDWFFYRRSKIVGYIGTVIIFTMIVFGDSLIASNSLMIKIEILGIAMALGGFYGPQIKRFFKGIDEKKK